MKNFVKKRLEEIGMHKSELMQKLGLDRSLPSKVNTMQNKISDLNDFLANVDCEVIIVDKREPIEPSINYKKIFPL